MFGFQLIEKRADKLFVLQNAEGFLLTLHDDLSTRNYMAPKPAKLQRGGPPTYGFYYDAPGGVMVEVSYDEHCRTLLTASPSA